LRIRLGVNLAPVVVKHKIRLEDLRGRTLAVDANNFLYQFLALIRMADGSPLTSPNGTVTSHLAGLMYRSTRLICEYGINLVFVFDGIPPKQKDTEISKRRKNREKATIEWKLALEAKDYAKAFSKAVMTSRLTRSMIEDAKKLLHLLGIPQVQAPSEAESQAAYMAMKGDAWASSSRDFDSLLFGTPKLVRYLTITGIEFLPSKGISRRLEPELIFLDEFLSRYGITRNQLVDAAILIGTDFNDGVRGVGPKKSVKLITEFGTIENLPSSIKMKLTQNYNEVRNVFLEPDVDRHYVVKHSLMQEDELYDFLCDQKGFRKERVEKVIERVKRYRLETKQTDLQEWFTSKDTPKDLS